MALALAMAAGIGVALTAEVRSRPGPTEPVRDVAVDAPDDDVLGRVARRRAPRPPPTRVPLCTGEPQCFAWAVQVGNWSQSLPDVVTDELVLTHLAGGQLRAYRLTDGALVWAQPFGTPAFRGWMELRVAEDLLLHDEDGRRLVGRNLVDGSVRWMTTEPLLERLWGAETIDGELLVVGNRLAGDARGQPAATIANIDATTGSVRWQAHGRHATVGPDAAFLVDHEWRLARLDGSGRALWRTEPLEDLEHGWVWPAGPVLAISDGDRTRLLRTADGAPVADIGGYPIAHDDDTAAVVDHLEQGGVLVHLVTDGGVQWTASSPATDCWLEADLTTTAVDVRLCDGATVTYDRADGSELASTSARTDAWWVWAGPYTLDDSGQVPGETAVRQAATGREIARLPAPTHPIARSDGYRWTHDLDGIALLHTGDWLVAVRLPAEPVER